MTKWELFKEYQNLLEQKGIVNLSGISFNSNKKMIELAIECLKCSDEQLDKYLLNLKEVYPNTYKTIVANGDFKSHPHNRLYVYHTVKMLKGFI